MLGCNKQSVTVGIPNNRFFPLSLSIYSLSLMRTFHLVLPQKWLVANIFLIKPLYVSLFWSENFKSVDFQIFILFRMCLNYNMLDLQTVVCFNLFKNPAKTLVRLINLIPTIFTDDFNIKRSIDSFFIKKAINILYLISNIFCHVLL